uniref:Uncharacterized protein n=1 Tax=Setaria italica TaxID=4555 RepID=K4AIB4_SETIT
MLIRATKRDQSVRRWRALPRVQRERPRHVPALLDWQDEERSDSGGHGAWASAWYACPRQRLWQGGMRASSSSSSNDSARGAHRVLDEMLEEGRRDKRGDVQSTRHVIDRYMRGRV